MGDRIRSREFTKSLTGWDEIAIRKAFGSSLEDLEGSLIPRALLFVQRRREGAKDAQAYIAAMDLPMGDLEKLFESDAEGKADGPATTTDSSEPSPTS
jgi:hypothetical protein